MDKGFLNVWLLSIAFMLLFTAFQCLGIIMKTILEGVKVDNPDFYADGYICMALIYATFAIANLFVPPMIALIGPRITMDIGAACYIGYLACFLYPIEILIYVMSAVLGFGAALIWTAQGNYLVINTPKEKMGRNSGIFWAMLQLSLIFGNTVIIIAFSGQEYIGSTTRILVIFILLGVAVGGFIMFIFLPRGIRLDAISVEAEEKPSTAEILKGAGRLFKTKHMLLLSVAFFYGGLELAFFSGVYGSCVGFTLQLENSKSLIGYSGIAIGIGEVIGGAIFGLLGEYTSKIGRGTIVVFGCILHLISFALISINLPNNSPFGDTFDDAIIQSNMIIAIACGFTLGLADACYKTQYITILGETYQNNSASAFAIYKLIENIGAFVGFLYSTHLILYGNLGLLTGFALLATICFLIAGKLEINEDEVVNYKMKTKDGPSTSA